MAAAPGVAPTTYRAESLPKKNGRYHVVLLAGGPNDVAREVRDKLAASRDIYVKYHLPMERPTLWSRPIPKDVDFVIFIKDMLGHVHTDKLVPQLKADGIRFVHTKSKMSVMLAALNNYGVRAAPPLDGYSPSKVVWGEELPFKPASRLPPPPAQEEAPLQPSGLPDAWPEKKAVLVSEQRTMGEALLGKVAFPPAPVRPLPEPSKDELAGLSEEELERLTAPEASIEVVTENLLSAAQAIPPEALSEEVMAPAPTLTSVPQPAAPKKIPGTPSIELASLSAQVAALAYEEDMVVIIDEEGLRISRRKAQK